MAAAGAGGSCLSLWREENDGLVRRWRRVTKSSGLHCSVKNAAQECQLAFTKLLQKIQGLPAARPAMALELTVLGNALLFDLQQPCSSGEKLSAVTDGGLSRVLEACGVPDQGLSSEERWQRVFRERSTGSLAAPLHRLAALQGILWFTARRLEKAEGLFQLLGAHKSPEPPQPRGHQNGLLSLVQAWRPPPEEEEEEEGRSGPLPVQSAKELKEILWTLAAVWQGVQDLEEDAASSALATFQAAVATGLGLPRRLLAQIFTLMGCCNLKLEKPQVALQHLKQALQVDFTFLPALYQVALLYRQLELLEAELESLALLYQALEGPAQMTTEPISPGFLIRMELFTHGPRLTTLCVENCPTDVKYLLAQRCLQVGRVSEAAEHYLDLLALLQERPFLQCREPAWPRIPEVFLEAASALAALARSEEAMAICEEVVARTSQLIPPQKLCIGLPSSAEEAVVLGAEGSLLPSPAALPRKQAMESLRCVLWRAAAYLIQGWARARQRETREAIGCLSSIKMILLRSLPNRCLNDLLKVRFVNTGSTEAEVERSEGKVLPQIRQLALTGRGAQFLELGQEKEALRDFQHSLLVCPESPTAAHWYVLHTLWTMGRRPEAAERWQKLHLNPISLEEKPERSFPLYLLLYAKEMKFPHMESLTRNMESFAKEL